MTTRGKAIAREFYRSQVIAEKRGANLGHPLRAVKATKKQSNNKVKGPILTAKSAARMGLTSGAFLLQSGAVGDIFEEAGESGLAFFSERGGDDHALRLDAAKFTGSEVGDDHHLAAYQRLGGVRLGDSGDDLTNFGADVDGEAQEFVGLLYLFGGEDGADTELDLEEIVDRDVGVGRGGRWCSHIC